MSMLNLLTADPKVSPALLAKFCAQTHTSPAFADTERLTWVNLIAKITDALDFAQQLAATEETFSTSEVIESLEGALADCRLSLEGAYTRPEVDDSDPMDDWDDEMGALA
jgi:hypothetical protein